MTSRKVCLVAALCSILILTTFTGTAESAGCCLRYVKRHLPCRRIMDYTVQTINQSCDIKAIIFHVSGRFVCANPDMIWTQTRMKCVDFRKKILG